MSTIIKFGKLRHVGYSSELSPEENVVLGRNKGFSYLRIGKELNLLATLNKSNHHAHAVFKEASRIAYRMHDEYKR